MNLNLRRRLVKECDAWIVVIIRYLVKLHTRLILEQHITKQGINIEELFLVGENKDVVTHGISEDKQSILNKVI